MKLSDEFVKRLVADGSAISTVTIRDPTPPHSGLYNCRPANLEPAHVNLHVIQGIYIIFEFQILVLKVGATANPSKSHDKNGQEMIN